uniref:Transmembrane protein 185B n=1 Tax=Angiostrongylus cantonensis TaxID=6313 RepID=A0A0K0D9K5_ANGCA
MLELSLGFLFRGFNASKFVTYLCLLFFVLLLCLKLDNKIEVGYAIVFLPIWLYNLMVFTGAILELSDIFRGSLELHWIVVFSPLFTLSVASIGLVVWAIRRDKSFEVFFVVLWNILKLGLVTFELFFAINIVQLFFLAFKLDDLVDWSWAVVFIPLWVVLSLSAVGVLYALVLSIVLARSRHLVPSHRRRHVTSALFHACLVVPALICMVLLTGKLDSSDWGDHDPTSDMPFIVSCSTIPFCCCF